MLNFPSSPIDNQLFAATNGATYRWSSTYELWNDIGSTGTLPPEPGPGPTPDTVRVIYVEDFGAVGDGTVDDTASIQDAVNSATGEYNIVEFRAGAIYKITDIINVTRSNITFRGNGAVVNGATSPVPATYDSQCAFLVAGTLSTTAVGTVDVAIVPGTPLISVDSAAAFADNDIVFVESTTMRYPSGTTDWNAALKGEMHRVRTADSGADTITLMDGMFFAYDITTTKVTKVLAVNDVVFEDLYIVMGGDNRAHCGVRFRYTTDCWWRGGGVKDCEETAIRFSYGIGGGVEDADISGGRGPVHGDSLRTVIGAALSPVGTIIRLTLTSPRPGAATAGMVSGERRGVRLVTGTVEANGTWEINVIDASHIDLVGSVFANAYAGGGNMGTGTDTGYGVNVHAGTRDFVVRDCAFRDNKHSVAGGGAHPAMLVNILDNSIDGSRLDPQGGYDIECHEECPWWTFRGNRITGSTGSTGSGGLLIRGQWCIVDGNQLVNSWQYGIYIKSFDNNQDWGMSGCVVTNNIINNPDDAGIYVAGETVCHHRNIQIMNNHVFNAGREGIRCDVMRDSIISGNMLFNCGRRVVAPAPYGASALQLTGAPPVTMDILGAANNGAGLVRLTVPSILGLVSGNSRHVSGVVGTAEANGQWVITIPVTTPTNTKYIDLEGSAFLNPYVSGGKFCYTAITGAVRRPDGPDARFNGWIRLTVVSTVPLQDYMDLIGVPRMNVEISGVLGTTEANGYWEINIADSSHIDLVESQFVNTYAGGGLVGETTSHCADILVSNNFIERGGAYGIHAQYTQWINASGNTIKDTRLSAIRYECCENGTHTGGTITTSDDGQAGILYNNCKNMTLTGGMFENTHVAALAAAVAVSGVSSDITATSYTAKGYFSAYNGVSTSSNLIVSLVNGRQCLNPINITAVPTNINVNNL